MGEIKFRAWDKENKTMLLITQMLFNQWWVSCIPIIEHMQPSDIHKYGERNSFKNEQTDRHILMQYTGLSDKNGTPIYEGDIMLHDDSNWGYDGEYDKKHDGYLRTVVPSMQAILNDEFDYEPYQLRYWEIIGNQYENPNLLGGQDG